MTVIMTTAGPRALAERKAWPLAGAGSPAGTNLAQRRGVELLGDQQVGYATLYRSQPWVHVVVNKLARGIARLPLHTFALDSGTGERERVREDELARLMERPYPGGSPFRLKEATVASMAMFGNALWVLWRRSAGRPPEEIWPVPWQNITPIAGESTPIAAYRYRGPAGERVFLASDVVHFSWWSPTGLGISPLEPLRVSLELEAGAQRYAIASFANAARPSGAVTTERTLKRPQREELRAEIEALHQGPDNAFRIALLDGGLEWRPFGGSAHDSELIETRKLTREEVAAAYDLPPPVIGILDRATFSNISEQHRMLYQDSFGPWLTMLEETIAAQLVAPEPSFAGRFCEFNLAEVLKGDPNERGQFYQRQMQSGVATPNELRALENRSPIDDPLADSIFLPVNMQPAGPGAKTAQSRESAIASLSAALTALTTGVGEPSSNGAG